MPTSSVFSHFLSKWINKGLQNGGTISNAASIFGFLAPVGPAVLGTYLMNSQYIKNNMPNNDRKMLISQEMVSQGLNVFAHWLSFGLFFLATRKLINRYGDPKLLMSRKGLDGKELNKEYHDAAAAIRNLACALGGFFGMSVVRPLLAATILKEWKKREQETTTPASESPNAPTTINHPQASPAKVSSSQPFPKSPSLPSASKSLNILSGSNPNPNNINAFVTPIFTTPQPLNNPPLPTGNVVYVSTMPPMRRTTVGA